MKEQKEDQLIWEALGWETIEESVLKDKDGYPMHGSDIKALPEGPEKEEALKRLGQRQKKKYDTEDHKAQFPNRRFMEETHDGPKKGSALDMLGYEPEDFAKGGDPDQNAMDREERGTHDGPSAIILNRMDVESLNNIFKQLQGIPDQSSMDYADGWKLWKMARAAGVKGLEIIKRGTGGDASTITEKKPLYEDGVVGASADYKVGPGITSTDLPNIVPGA